MNYSKMMWLILGGIICCFFYLVRQSLIRKAQNQQALEAAFDPAAPSSSKKRNVPLSVEHYLSLPAEKDVYNDYEQSQDASLSVSSFYDYLAHRKPELKQFERQIYLFYHNRDSLFTPFNDIQQKCNNYYGSILNIVEPKKEKENGNDSEHTQEEPAFKDTELKKQIRILIQNSQKEYQSRQIEWTSLIDQLDKREAAWDDYYLLFKVQQTLPFIEQYHQKQIAQLKELQEAKKLLLQQAALQQQIDSLMKKK